MMEYWFKMKMILMNHKIRILEYAEGEEAEYVEVEEVMAYYE